MLFVFIANTRKFYLHVWLTAFRIPAGSHSTGVFGVPLEILVEKTGSDSQLGLTNAQLRVPEFIDNVISAMKQMGE